jgi:DNA polymerase-3 subunit gamma/tau
VAGEEATPYQALYRRFRPQRFSEVVGQDHVTRALRTAVRDGRVAHAYLFSGPRGTGKTSTARILAMALNCEKPEAGEPCGVCGSCQSVRSGASLDVVELDSASNRGIDEMRDLLSRVALGTPGRWKVYIVDEVHQVSSAAASALLKTLEDPPGHVIFVLATTDPQKVLDTIRSRTQHFEFRLLGPETLAGLLEDVARRARIDLDRAALDVVVRRGHGSARDALSALDQMAAAGTWEDDSRSVQSLVEALADRDAGGVLARVAEAARAGFDARRLGTEVLEHLRNAFLVTRAPDLVLLGPEPAAELRIQAKRLGAAGLVRAMDEVGRAVIDMRDSADPRTTLEVALVRLAAPELDESRAALVERIERLERAVAAAAGGAGPVPAGGASPAPVPPAGAGRVPVPPAGAGREAAHMAPRPPRSAASDPESRLRSGGMGAPPPMPGRPQPDVGRPVGAPTPPTGESSGDGAAAPPRDALTLAWADHILPGLRPAVKVYVANGRFLPNDSDGAVLALPDRGLLVRAAGYQSEIQAALTRHFGYGFSLRLVLDPGSGPTRTGPETVSSAGVARGVPDEAPADEEIVDLNDLADAPPSSPTERLLQAFPGAEEI